MKTLTWEQHQFLTRVIGETFLDDIGERFVDFTEGDDEQKLLDVNNCWKTKFVRSSIVRVLKENGYRNEQVGILNSLRIHYIRKSRSYKRRNKK